MDVKCPRCENEFEIDELVYGDDVKCEECGLFIKACHDDGYEYFDGEYMQYCYIFNDIPAACCKTCENLNIQSCIGICKMDSAE